MVVDIMSSRQINTEDVPYSGFKLKKPRFLGLTFFLLNKAGVGLYIEFLKHIYRILKTSHGLSVISWWIQLSKNGNTCLVHILTEKNFLVYFLEVSCFLCIGNDSQIGLYDTMGGIDLAIFHRLENIWATNKGSKNYSFWLMIYLFIH